MTAGKTVKPLTKEGLKDLEHAAWDTWSAIAADVLNGRPYLRRSEVLELIFDADRIVMYGKPSPEVLAWLDAASYRTKCRTLSKTLSFQDALYGI